MFMNEASIPLAPATFTEPQPDERANGLINNSEAPAEPAPKAETPVEETPAEPAPAPVSDSGSLVDLVMPKMGESLQEGTVIKWMKNIGDKIDRDEMILEISTDKVDTEVPSPVEGVLAEILANEGDTVEVGVTIARISTSGSVPAAKPAEKPAETPKPVESAPPYL